MASRTQSRRTLRDQYDHAEQAGVASEGDESDEPVKAKKPRVKKAGTAKVPKEKAPAKPRAVRKKTVKAALRMCAQWAVCDNGLQRLAMFEYKDRAGADAKLSELRERKSGTFYLQLVKVPYDPPLAVEVPTPAV